MSLRDDSLGLVQPGCDEGNHRTCCYELGLLCRRAWSREESCFQRSYSLGREDRQQEQYWRKNGKAWGVLMEPKQKCWGACGSKDQINGLLSVCVRLYCLPAPGDALSEPAIERGRNLCTCSYVVSFFNSIMKRDNFCHWSLLPLRELWRVLRVEMPRLSDPVKWRWWKLEVSNVWNPRLKSVQFCSSAVCRYPTASDTPQQLCGALKPVNLSCPGGSAQQAIGMLVPF